MQATTAVESAAQQFSLLRAHTIKICTVWTTVSLALQMNLNVRIQKHVQFHSFKLQFIKQLTVLMNAYQKFQQ